MFTAAATCLRYTEQVSHDTSCQDKHEDTCNTAFVFLNKILAWNNDNNQEPHEKDEAAAIAESQVPDVMIDVLRRFVCSRHAVDPETGKTFWRIKRLEGLDLMTTGQDASLENSPLNTVQTESNQGVSTASRHSGARTDSDSSDE